MLLGLPPGPGLVVPLVVHGPSTCLRAARIFRHAAYPVGLRTALGDMLPIANLGLRR